MKHTPTPWVLKIEEEKNHAPEIKLTIYSEQRLDEFDDLMDNTTYYPTVPENIDDWKFIVQAVNSHDELLEAANDILINSIDMGDHYEVKSKSFEKLEKAIQKAEGKQEK